MNSPAAEPQGQYGPLSPTLSPSEGERGNRRQVAGEPRFRGREKPRRAPCHSLIQRQWGWGEGHKRDGRRRQQRLPGVTASSPHPSPPKEEREIESSVGGSVKMRPREKPRAQRRVGQERNDVLRRGARFGHLDRPRDQCLLPASLLMVSD